MRQESDAGIGNVTRMKERALCHDCIRAAPGAEMGFPNWAGLLWKKLIKLNII